MSKRTLELRLLGPVALHVTGAEIPLGPPQQRSVLAALAMTPGYSVAMDKLIERVWGERLPRDARSVLYTYVSRLRRTLTQARGKAALRGVGGGYLLDIAPDLIDLHRARRLVCQARAAMDGNHPNRDQNAAQSLIEASALWQGTPLAGLRGTWADRTREALSEERLTILTELFAVRLRLRQHLDVIGPLSDALNEYPLAESLAALLMIALYRSGQQAESLRVYGRIRQQLIDEIGAEPGNALRKLHEQVLRNDPLLDWDAQSAGNHRLALEQVDAVSNIRTTSAVRPAQLPPDNNIFVGRERELMQLNGLLTAAGTRGRTAVFVLEGTAGVGKTALAVRLAHQNRARFADGQLYVDLRGHAAGRPLSPLSVLSRFLHALGVSSKRVPADIDEATGLYRSLLADKQILVVLDNAASSEQILPLLPGAGRSVALVTSRVQLTGLLARGNARRISLGVLTPDEAYALLCRVLGVERMEVEADAAAQLAARCSYLPLALCIAAANLAARPHRSIASYAAQLGASDRLSALTVHDDANTAVRTAFDLSYNRLPDEAKRLFRLLGLMPGPDFRVEHAAAMLDLEQEQTRRLIDILASAHLIEERFADTYAIHDLLREYAAERCQREAVDARAALGRLLTYYLNSIDEAARLLYPEKLRLPPPARCRSARSFVPGTYADALAWLDDERNRLVGAVIHAHSNGWHRMAWLLADALRGYFLLRRHLVDWVTVGEAAASSARAEDEPAAEASALLSLGDACLARGDYQQAITNYQHGLSISQKADSRHLTLTIWNNLAVAFALSGRPRDAHDYWSSLLDTPQTPLGKAIVLDNLGAVCRAMGALDRSACYHTQALTMWREAGSRGTEAQVLNQLGQTYHALGKFNEALDYLVQALPIVRLVGDRAGEADTERCLAAVYADRGRPALEIARSALALARGIDERPIEADALNTLGTVYQSLHAYRPGIKCHQRALELAEQMRSKYPRAEALIGLAACHQLLGQHREAHLYIRSALTVSEEAGFGVLEGRALTVLAAVQLAEGDSGQALHSAEKALASHRRTGHRLGEARTYLVLSNALKARDRADEAREQWRRGQGLLVEMGSAEAARAAALPGHSA